MDSKIGDKTIAVLYHQLALSKWANLMHQHIAELVYDYHRQRHSSAFTTASESTPESESKVSVILENVGTADNTIAVATRIMSEKSCLETTKKKNYGRADVLFVLFDLCRLTVACPPWLLKRAIVMQSECANSELLDNPHYISAMLGSALLLDFSKHNATALANSRFGEISNLTMVSLPAKMSLPTKMDVLQYPPRCTSGVDRQAAAKPLQCLTQCRDIDILFVGSLNQRRECVLNQVNELLNKRDKCDFKIYTLFGGVSPEILETAFFNRTKVVLNLHYHDWKTNMCGAEFARIIPALECGCVVITDPLATEDEMFLSEYRDHIEFLTPNLDESAQKIIHAVETFQEPDPDVQAARISAETSRYRESLQALLLKKILCRTEKKMELAESVPEPLAEPVPTLVESVSKPLAEPVPTLVEPTPVEPVQPMPMPTLVEPTPVSEPVSEPLAESVPTLVEPVPVPVKIYQTPQQQQQQRHPMNEYFDNIYCVNLARRTERMEIARRRHAFAGLDVERFVAIDGSVLGALHRSLGAGSLVPNKAYLGCQLSHLSIYRDALDRGFSRVLIIEDDVRIHRRSGDIFRKFIAALPTANDWDMLHMAYIPLSDDLQMWTYNVVFNNAISEHVMASHNLWSLMAYAVSRRMMQHLLNLYDQQMPMELDRLFVTKIFPDKTWKCYGSIPQIFCAEDNFSDNAATAVVGLLERSVNLRVAAYHDYV